MINRTLLVAAMLLLFVWVICVHIVFAGRSVAMAFRSGIQRVLGHQNIVVSLVAVSAITVAYILTGGSQTAAAGPLFHVVDVRAEYGHMIVEVQFFKDDGSHAYFEHFTFQGREEARHPRALVANQFYLLASNNQVAPFRLDANGVMGQYLPEGDSWKREANPYLDQSSILRIIKKIDGQRRGTDWPHGKLRLTTEPLDSSPEDNANVAALAARFQFMVGTAYAPTARPLDANVVLYASALPPPNIPHGNERGTVSTFFPDGTPESTSVDGNANESAGDGSEPWATVRGGPGDVADDTSVEVTVEFVTSTTTDEYDTFRRGILLFDTSTLPDADNVTAADLDIVLTGITDNFSDSLSVVTSTPASNTAVVPGDYTQLGTTKQASDQTLASMTADSSTVTTFTLNAAGEGNVTRTGVSKFGLRLTRDNDDNEPTWASAELSRVKLASAEELLSGDKRPALVVTHVAITAAITGTVGDGATEQEVRNGAGTIIITMTNDTFVAGAAYDAQRQAIINGLDAAESETNGWNAQVRDQIAVGAVSRTSSTISTITVSAAAVSSYRIDINEVVTTTVPGAALVLAAGAVTATPTTTITAADEVLTITGTLGGSGGTPAEIVAGGQTVIATLTDTVWVASGDFNAQRQAILDGLVSDLSDQNGWDSQAFAVGDVVRTSATVVTITLTAETDYAIPTAETVTTTAPASAMIFGVAVVAPETFAITPTFQASGTRLSTTIDLSSVTDVAYCAIGWESVTPTNTTVAIDTSVDGGASFSSATNGSCPTGITVGASLASITDFRVRVTLTTTDSSVTPLITTLGLIIEDASGQELYYQLNTTPSATLTDRSSQSHTGTMSFPITPSGVTAATDPLTTTRTALSPEQAIAAPNAASEVTGSATSVNLFNQDEVGFAGLPGKGLIDAIAGTSGLTGGLPTRFVWFIFLGFTIIAAGAVTIILSGSMLAAAAAMAATMGFWLAVGNGLLPGWTLFVFIPIAGILILVRGRSGGILDV